MTRDISPGRRMLRVLSLGCLGVVPQAAIEPATRSRILDLVRGKPGLPIGEVSRQVGIRLGTMHYHLFRLLREGRLHVVKTGRRCLLYPGPTTLHADPHHLAALHGRTCRSIAKAIIDSPDCSIEHIVERTGESSRVVYYHVKILKDLGLVRSSSPTRYRHLHPTPTLGDVMSTLEPRTQE